VIDQYLVAVAANPIIGDTLFRQRLVYRDFVAAVEKNTDVIGDRMSGCRGRTGAFPIFKDFSRSSRISRPDGSFIAVHHSGRKA
jgi:hypothetical protein